MSENLRKTFGGSCWTVLIALTWNDEGRVVPFWLKTLIVPTLFVLGGWAFKPLILKELATLRRKPEEPSKLLGVEVDQPKSPSKLWAAIVLCLLSFAALSTVFVSGYSCHAHLAQPVAQDTGGVESLRTENGNLRTEWGNAIKDRDSWRAKFDEEAERAKSLEQQVSGLTAKRDTLTAQLDDREQRSEKRALLTEWVKMLRAVNTKVLSDQEVTDEDFAKLTKQFAGFLATNFPPEDIALFDSAAGISTPAFFPKSLIKIKDETEKQRRRSMYSTLYVWEVRAIELSERLANPE